MTFPIPVDEADRLSALARYSILDTPPEQDFDDITLLASFICDTPFALISLLDESRQWFKSAVGIPVNETAREVAFCSHAIMQSEMLVVQDALQDARFANNPLVTGDPNIRFYAGSQLVTPDGHRLGTLCVIDKKPRELLPKQVAALQALSRQVITQLEFRQVSNQLDLANKALKAENIERTQTADRLRHHMLELEARNEDLDAFAHTVAHDLRNPLNIVNNLAMLLSDGFDDLSLQKTKELLATIAHSSQKMNQIIDALLLLAGVRNETVRPEMLDMRQIVAEAEKRLKNMIDDLGATVAYPPHWPAAVGYAPWIEEVWVNYLSNALKYGGRPPKLELGARRSGASVTFWIRDNGDGVPSHKKEDIFRPFQRLNQIEIQGYGLGLSIVRKIIERLGGQVGVKSSGVKGEGSTFFFTLPSKF